MPRCALFALSAFLAVTNQAHGFGWSQRSTAALVKHPVCDSNSSLNMFGKAFSSAFSNDESLGKVQNAGLKGGPKNNDKVSINGKPVKAIVGQKVAVVAGAARAKISYNCKQGDCGTCMIKMNGRKVKACQMSIPAGKCNIETL